jgi:hypothetical protein
MKVAFKDDSFAFEFVRNLGFVTTEARMWAK